MARTLHIAVFGSDSQAKRTLTTQFQSPQADADQSA